MRELLQNTVIVIKSTENHKEQKEIRCTKGVQLQKKKEATRRVTKK